LKMLAAESNTGVLMRVTQVLDAARLSVTAKGRWPKAGGRS
jgi:hypothetical protein